VTCPFGHTVSFAYDWAGRLSQMTTPDGNRYGYTYSGSNLVSVVYPGGAVRGYLYENSLFPHALTGITDENGNRFATYAYDAQGRAISTEHAGGVEKTTIVYNADGSSGVTDPRGNAHGYQFTTQFDLVKPIAVSGTPVPTVGAKAISYDPRGFVASRTDFRNVVTNYTHDARGLETVRTEAVGTPLARTLTTTWHASFHLPTRMTEPNRVRTFGYDAKGNLTQKTVTAGALSRTWFYSYNANGQVTQVNGPRTDVNDITKYAYDAKGNLSSLTDALNHVTRISAYDANGRPLTIVDPNGLTTALAYDARGRLISRSVGGETTTYGYDAVGQLLRVTQPDGSYTAYGYDLAHRLIQLRDNLGNRIVYTLDASGNRIKEDIYDPTNALARTRSSTFDALDRLAKSIGAQGQTTAYGYDDNGNLTSVADPLLHSSTHLQLCQCRQRGWAPAQNHRRHRQHRLDLRRPRARHRQDPDHRQGQPHHRLRRLRPNQESAFRL
jgi:YD repeat-containing protein